MTTSEYIKYQIPEWQLTTFKTLFINCYLSCLVCLALCGKKLFWKQR